MGSILSLSILLNNHNNHNINKKTTPRYIAIKNNDINIKNNDINIKNNEKTEKNKKSEKNKKTETDSDYDIET